MNTRILAPVMFAMLLGSTSAFAAAGKVTISSPKDGAMFTTNDDIVLHYAAIPGPDGNHLHLIVDGNKVDEIYQLNGTEDVGTLGSGKHHICLAISNAAHIPTGVEGCIDVAVK
jgi:hypothetical protein